jgi:hypothetical protein
MASAEVEAAESLPGPWLVLGAHRSDDGRLQQQRTWLRGPEGEIVVVLDFAAQGQTLAVPQLAGAVLDVTVARYPGSAPRRALFTGPILPRGVEASLGDGGGIADALETEAAAVARSPWRDRHPVLLGGVRVSPGNPGWLRDRAGEALPILGGSLTSLLALTGGHPVDIFGELEDGRVRPLSLVVDGEVVTA